MAKPPVPLEWAIEGVARKMIADALGHPMASYAYGDLLAACRDGDVRARVTLCNDDGSLGQETQEIQADYWRAGLDGGIAQAPWQNDLNGLVEIHIGDVRRWLRGAQHPHRPKGTGLEAADAPILAEMRHLLDAGRASSPTAAAQIIARNQSLPGAGTLESRIDRLVRRFGDLNRE